MAKKILQPNPPLVVYGNPPVRFRDAVRAAGRFKGKLSEDVHEIRYTHFEDGEFYKHPFGEDGVEMWAIEEGGERRILLKHKNGLPLWGDFDR